MKSLSLETRRPLKSPRQQRVSVTECQSPALSDTEHRPGLMGGGLLASTSHIFLWAFALYFSNCLTCPLLVSAASSGLQIPLCNSILFADSNMTRFIQRILTNQAPIS